MRNKFDLQSVEALHITFGLHGITPGLSPPGGAHALQPPPHTASPPGESMYKTSCCVGEAALAFSSPDARPKTSCLAPIHFILREREREREHEQREHGQHEQHEQHEQQQHESILTGCSRP